MNRFEHGAVSHAAEDRYKRVEVRNEAVENLLIDLFVEAQPTTSKRFILDLDATDDPVHGGQEGRFFHGYYGHYCYLPLYIACGDSIFWAELRPSNIDAAKGSVEALERTVSRIRQRFPSVEILVRADSGFAREKLMTWCEANDVEHVLGLARNPRLERSIRKELERAGREHARSKKPERCLRDFTYQTNDTWSRRRRVIGKAEVLERGLNPRFLVTSLKKTSVAAEALYDLYCLRGEMENRIKEQQLDLFAGRTGKGDAGEPLALADLPWSHCLARYVAAGGGERPRLRTVRGLRRARGIERRDRLGLLSMRSVLNPQATPEED